MIAMLPESRGDVVAVRANGQLTHEDYEQFRTRVEQTIREHGGVRVLMEFGDDFRGWTPGAAWDDMKLGLRHFSQFERCALVGDRAWEKWMVMLAKPFFRVEFFDRSQREEARRWLEEPAGATRGPLQPWLHEVNGFIRRHPVPTVLLALGLGFVAMSALRRPARAALSGR